jgi:hypothetical protein
LATLALGACSREDNTGTEDDVETLTPATIDYLMFPNPQAGVGVGDYSVVFSNVSLSVDPQTYTLTVVQTNGANQTFTGIWTSGSTVTQPIQVRRAAGMTITLRIGGDSATLSLRNAGDSNDIATTTATNPTLTVAAHSIDQAAYSNAYYVANDPGNLRATLAGFKTTNGFGANCAPNGVDEFEIRFRDVEDLGYGRHMCVRRNTGTGEVAAWVENFQVTAVPGQNYGPLNLTAVIDDDRKWHIGTNAIEYSPSPGTGYTKFYTFNPDGTRRVVVDLDGRGAKAMPVPCISCHGGTALPLTASGQFPTIGQFGAGNTRAQMQPLNVSTLDFPTTGPWMRTNQEASFKEINKIILCTYPLTAPSAAPEDACRPAVTQSADWQSPLAEMIKTWYEGTPDLADPSNNSDMESATQNDIYVPYGWTDAVAGAGAANVYTTVIAPYCRVCHATRGTGNGPGGNDIDFSSYDKLFGVDGYTARIKHHVFDMGNMPLAVLKFDQFWDSAAPNLLAPLVGADNGSGAALQPNRPVAIPGPDRTLVTGIATKISGAESINAVSYRWQVTSSNSANVTLTNANTSRPTFLANADGTYTLDLIVNDGTTDSAPATLTIATLPTLTDGGGVVTVTDPAAIRFSDIRAILQDNSTYSCTSGCHTNTVDGPPVFYNNYDRDGGGLGASDTHQFYLDIRARLNFADVEASRLLQRPSGHHHPGGLRPNFDNSLAPGNAGRGAYDIVLNWILNGAPE